MTDSSFPSEPVDSSNLSTVGYDASTKELTVTFKKSGKYVYHGVSPKDAVTLLYADSKGKMLNSLIKPKYDFTK